MCYTTAKTTSVEPSEPTLPSFELTSRARVCEDTKIKNPDALSGLSYLVVKHQNRTF
jgi:hypothetical protein